MGVDDTRLLAMGAYSSAFADWRPTAIDGVPTLAVRASEPAWDLADGEAEAWQATWDLSHLAVEVPGGHFTMITEHAETTAEAVRAAMEEGGLA